MSTGQKDTEAAIIAAAVKKAIDNSRNPWSSFAVGVIVVIVAMSLLVIILRIVF